MCVVCVVCVPGCPGYVRACVRACVCVCVRVVRACVSCVGGHQCVREHTWMVPSSIDRTGMCDWQEKKELLVGGLDLELAGYPMRSQLYEIAWACTAAPVLNLVLLLNLACMHGRVQLYCTRVRTCNLVLVY